MDEHPINMEDKVAVAKMLDELDKSGVLRGNRCLTLQHANIAEWNDKILEKLQGDLQTKFAAEKINETGFPPMEFLRTLDCPSLPPSHLRLKLGAPVMLLRDLVGVCKGTRLRLTRIGQYVIEGEVLGGAHDGEKHLIPRIPMSSVEGELPWIISRSQFPIRLCFAVGVQH